MPGRILGLDVGTQRIGVAVSDEQQMLARELNTIQVTNMRSSVAHIMQLIAEMQIVTVVIGLPLTLSGDEGEQARITRLFGTRLSQDTQIPLVYIDERFTSKLSDSTLHELSISRAKKKGRRDGLSALFILQLYLDREHGKKESK